MNATDREQLRLSLLRFLEANSGSRYGLSTGLLRQMAASEGFDGVTEGSIDAELRYLAAKGFVEERAKTISPENRVWRITAAGRDHFAQL